MNKPGATTFVAIAVAVVGWLVLQNHEESSPIVQAAALNPLDSGTSASAGAPSIDIIAPEIDAAATGPFPAVASDAGADDATATLGGTIPELSDAPDSLGFGVILVRNEGAEGAKGVDRSRAEAKSVALELVSAAQDDFAEAAKQGDRGSRANVGRMFKGILEPAAEYALFSLSKGEVSEPVDTPRGYWIVKRLD